MKTDALIDALARGPVATTGPTPAQRLALAGAAGIAIGVALVLALLGARADLAAATATSLFWLKLGFPALLAGCALWATARLGRPGARAAAAGLAIAALLLAIEIGAGATLAAAAPEERLALVFGRTALACVASIVLLSLPILVVLVLALRGGAPTRLRAAGIAAGTAAGAIAAAAYALHCDESTVAFLATWYVLGIAVPAALGALLGPRLLRWS
jgi:hypothetical protein